MLFKNFQNYLVGSRFRLPIHKLTFCDKVLQQTLLHINVNKVIRNSSQKVLCSLTGQIFLPVAQPWVGQGLLISEASRSHSETHSVVLLRTSDQSHGGPQQHTTQATSMPPAGFESTIPASDGPQTHALERTATGTGSSLSLLTFKDEVYLFYIRTQCVPRCKHFASVIKASLLMFCKAKVAVCSEIHTKHINAMWAPRRIF
jgi:hypothetical protein